jgi:hypothetical protein
MEHEEGTSGTPGASRAEVEAVAARVEAAVDRVEAAPPIPSGKVLDDPAALRAALASLQDQVRAQASALDAIAGLLRRQGWAI